MEMFGESWKECPSLPGYYASTTGKIMSTVRARSKGWKPHFLSLCFKGRYVRVSTLKGTKYAHCLVAEAFHGPKPAGVQCNHKDGNKHNNVPENLEYVTSKDNVAHAYRNDLVGARKALDPHAVNLLSFMNRQYGIPVTKLSGMFGCSGAAADRYAKGHRTGC